MSQARNQRSLQNFRSFSATSFLTNIQNVHTREKMTIKIIPLGQIEDLILKYLKDNLSDTFDTKVHLSKPQSIPEYAYDEKRNQYYSSEILENLSEFKNEQIILAVIERDLYVPELNFVFGEADHINGICIISLIRLNQSYYGLPEDKDLFLKRSLKEAVHEIGHLLGLEHCQNLKCVMHFSNSLLDTDIKDYHFCNNCKRYLP